MVRRRKGILSKDEAALCALRPRRNCSEPSAASRVCDERSDKNRRTALDPAPGSKGRVCLDNADAVIEGNLWRRLVLPQRIGNWSLTSLQQRLVKTGGRLLKHARYYWLLLAESH